MVMENQIIGSLQDKHDAEKLNLEKEWFHKTESGEIAEDEDDLISYDDDDEKAESEEDGKGMEMGEIQVRSPVDDDGDEEWEDFDDDDEENEVWSEAFVELLLE